MTTEKRSYKASVAKRSQAPYVQPKEAIFKDNLNEDKKNSVSEQVRLDRLKKMEAFTSVEERVSKSTVYIQYHCVDKLKAYFEKETKYKFRPNLYHVDKFYDFAYIEEPNGVRRRAPLCIDLPRNEYAISDCLEKEKACKKLGIRYAYILSGDTLDVVLERLGEI